MKLADILTLMQGYWLTLPFVNFRLGLIERGPENEFPNSQSKRCPHGWSRLGGLRHAATALFQSAYVPRIGTSARTFVSGEVQGG